jgi:hypothetical protein
VPITNPAVLQAATHRYIEPSFPPALGDGYAINADVTPSGGTQFNIPIRLNSNFGHGTGNSNNSGKFVSPPLGATSGNGYAVDIDGVGDLYVAGSYTSSSGAHPMAVTKFDATGAVVTSFGNNGTLTLPFDTGTDVAYDIELITGKGSPADAVYVAGTCASGWAVAKFSAGGVLDFGFGTGGMRSGFQAGQLNAVHFKQGLNGSGNILLAGRDNGTSTTNMVVYALNASTGATAWSKSFNFGASYGMVEAFDVLEQVSDNKVVVAGRACSAAGLSSNAAFALARLDASNPASVTFDTTFDGDGKVTTNFGCVIGGGAAATFDTAYSLVESLDHNSIYAVGSTNENPGSTHFAVVSYLQSNGSRDPNFHTADLPNGLAKGPLGTAYDAKIQGDSSSDGGFGMITAGGAGTPLSTSSDFVLARFETRESGATLGGSLDAGFGRREHRFPERHDIQQRLRRVPGDRHRRKRQRRPCLQRRRRRLQRHEFERREHRHGRVPAEEPDFHLLGRGVRRGADDGAVGHRRWQLGLVHG